MTPHSSPRQTEHCTPGASAGARGRTRTGTAFRPTDFKSVASTCSATRASMQWSNREAAMIALAANYAASRLPRPTAGGRMRLGKEVDFVSVFIAGYVVDAPQCWKT